MKEMAGWIVAVVVAVVATALYFLHPVTKAPAVTEQIQAPTQQPPVQQTENIGNPMMSGLWQSTSDTKFTREIRPDGVMIDRYAGDMGAGTGGQWSTVDPAQEPPIADHTAWIAGRPVIKVVWDGGVETTYFVVDKLSSTSLTTTDLTGQGAVTTYTKVNSTP